ncbi:MAG: two component transcriptional regulator [Herbinix sp.]|jgi:DNA-binding response OmpR family regulator|nr:two component transcriptional regulator [Herbinix sp.]
MKILVIEDEIMLADTLAEILKQNNYSVDLCYNGEKGWEFIQTEVYDGIVLDIMIPKMSGYEILKAMREANINTPVLILTARSEMEDIVTGLDCGADDYMTKPFAITEFLARVRAVTRRKEYILPENPSMGNVFLLQQQCTLSCKGNSISLGKKEYQIMEVLLNNCSQKVPKEQLIEKVWGFDSDCEYNNIEVYISFLRKKLKAIEADITINNTRGLGYYLEVLND